MQKINKIIGISGYSRSGKDTLAKYIIEKGYYGVSLGDMARDLTRKRHAHEENPISRINLTETSNWLRQEKGPEVLMNIALEEYLKASKNKSYKGLLIWSIRAPIEADFILNNQGRLIWIDSSPETRYERAMANLRYGEPHLDYQEYMRQESTQIQPQPGIDSKVQMNLDYIKKVSNIKINNNLSTEEFIKAAQKLLKTV